MIFPMAVELCSTCTISFMDFMPIRLIDKARFFHKIGNMGKARVRDLGTENQIVGEQKAVGDRVAKLESRLKAKPQKIGDATKEVSPRTKLPVEDPESQAVERIHYEMQQSLAGRKPTGGELREEALKQKQATQGE